VTACALAGSAHAAPILPPPPPLDPVTTVITGAESTATSIVSPTVASSHLTSSEHALVLDIDAIRKQQGKPAIAVSGALAAAALAHAKSMAARGYFSHSSPGGIAFWRRIARYYPYAGTKRWRVGENLYWSAGNPPASAAEVAWLNSPEHRRVLLGTWSEVGVAILHVAHAGGIFGGRDIVLVVADFGTRIPA
jgi:uncharacterized protein YkwD